MAKTSEEPIIINVLGSEWTIVYKDLDPAFDVAKGFKDDGARRITIQNLQIDDDDPLAFDLASQAVDQKRILRHEIIHAFLFESGLADDSNSADAWAVNEEMVDWFARQAPKIYKVYKELKLV